MSCWNPKSRSPGRRYRPVLSNRREDVIFAVPGARVHLVEDGKAVEIARGDFKILRIVEEQVPLAVVVQIGNDLQWPLTKDEPVVKLDNLHYLFTLPEKDGGFLNYGVSFATPDTYLASLDAFLSENACFSTPPKKNSSKPVKGSYQIYWKDYVPRVENYNGAMAKAIAGGTGEIVKGIFNCSNAYIRQVQKGAEMIQYPAPSSTPAAYNSNSGGINKALKSVRKLSEMTEKLSQALLEGVISLTESVGAPVMKSKAGKAFFTMASGEVLLASLDAVNKVLDALEVAQRNSLAATSNAVAGAVSKRYGESAGEAAEDAFAAAGHAVGTAWNILKIRKAVTPSSTLTSSILRHASKKN